MAEEKEYKPPRRRWRKGGTGRRAAGIREALERFLVKTRSRERFHLLHLWDNWPMVMGDDLAEAALPLGAKERTLIIGAEDNMLLHELSFQVNEILERTNAFMHTPYFSQVRLELLQGRRPLYPRTQTDAGLVNLPDERGRPEKLGGLKGKIDPESPAGKAYLAYVESFEEKP